MDIIELALVRERVAELHRDAQGSRLAATARTSRPHPHTALRTVARQAVDRASVMVRSLRVATTDNAQVCCA